MPTEIALADMAVHADRVRFGIPDEKGTIEFDGELCGGVLIVTGVLGRVFPVVLTER